VYAGAWLHLLAMAMALIPAAAAGEGGTVHQHACFCAGKEAAQLEAAFGIPVLRHQDKKPAGGCTELEQHFG
jgi:hypothetical protein